MVEAIEAGFPQREIMDAAFAYQRAFEEKEKLIVGVNAYQLENEPPIDILYIGDDLAERAGRLPERASRRSATRGRSGARWTRCKRGRGGGRRTPCR